MSEAGGPSPLRCCWNYKFLADFDLVGVLEIIGLGDGHVFVGVAVEVLADLGQVVAGLHGVVLGACFGFDVVLQVGEGWVYGLDSVPDAVLAGL